MKLVLIREYDPEVTEGILYDKEGTKLCYSLELPDKDNAVAKSCIPEGRYKFHKIFSQTFGWCYRLEGVEGRSLINIHAGNTVLDSRGCILVGQKRGTLNVKGKIYPAILDSKKALTALMGLVGNEGQITIKSKS